MHRCYLYLLLILAVLAVPISSSGASPQPMHSTNVPFDPIAVQVQEAPDAASTINAWALGEDFQLASLSVGFLSSCSGPYPDQSCVCGSCCENCKCWEGSGPHQVPYIALCF